MQGFDARASCGFLDMKPIFADLKMQPRTDVLILFNTGYPRGSGILVTGVWVSLVANVALEGSGLLNPSPLQNSNQQTVFFSIAAWAALPRGMK